MTSLVAAATAVAPAMLVAGTGAAAFGALAAPAIKGVIQYEQDLSSNTKKAAADWAKLTGEQKIMAGGLGELKTEFKGLSPAVEPEVMQVFDSLLADANKLLPEIVPMAQAGGKHSPGCSARSGPR